MATSTLWIDVGVVVKHKERCILGAAGRHCTSGQSIWTQPRRHTQSSAVSCVNTESRCQALTFQIFFTATILQASMDSVVNLATIYELFIWEHVARVWPLHVQLQHRWPSMVVIFCQSCPSCCCCSWTCLLRARTSRRPDACV